MMKAANYSEFAAHKPLHTDFLTELDKVTAPVAKAAVDFAKDWLVNHIKSTDHKYKGKL